MCLSKEGIHGYMHAVYVYISIVTCAFACEACASTLANGQSFVVHQCVTLCSSSGQPRAPVSCLPHHTLHPSIQAHYSSSLAGPGQHSTALTFAGTKAKGHH
jgi:hypothetical protein